MSSHIGWACLEVALGCWWLLNKYSPFWLQAAWSWMVVVFSAWHRHLLKVISNEHDTAYFIKTSINLMLAASYMDNLGNSAANTRHQTWLAEDKVVVFSFLESTQALSGFVVTHRDSVNCIASAGDATFKFLTHQLPTVGYWLTVALTGNGGLGFDSGEGARATATTSKEGSRRANYPILTQGGSDKK